MKATGIVRRIDDLGRVVIPKEIRRTMRIREATLEIYTDREGGVIFKNTLNWAMYPTLPPSCATPSAGWRDCPPSSRTGTA